MSNEQNALTKPRNRRSFLKTGLAAAGVATIGADLIGCSSTPALAQSQGGSTGSLSAGDAAILQFLAAGEALEADFWTQYNELGGVQDSIVPGGTGNPAYTAALKAIDPDFPQHIHDNTHDEISHEDFINAYLVSKGAAAIDLSPYRTLPGSTATGSSNTLRLTNLTQLTLDTSWWTRYRSSTNNPDVVPGTFEQAVPGLHTGQFTAIPRTDADLTSAAHLQAIANTAAFHMPTVEQGGGTLRMALALRVTSVEVLQIIISMGPIESMHFQTWHDKCGRIPLVTDPTNGLTFPDLSKGVNPNSGGVLPPSSFQSNLIMPIPCPFINANLPNCSVVRPTNTTGAATNALKFLTAMGLFVGQSSAFTTYLTGLATAADAATRGM